jgi:hypothetical protein
MNGIMFEGRMFGLFKLQLVDQSIAAPHLPEAAAESVMRNFPSLIWSQQI